MKKIKEWFDYIVFAGWYCGGEMGDGMAVSPKQALSLLPKLIGYNEKSLIQIRTRLLKNGLSFLNE